MYNRYIPDGGRYTRVIEEDDPPQKPADAETPILPGTHHSSVVPGSVEEEESVKKEGGLASILKSLKLDDLDTGDILLLLILLFLFLDGDDMELIITLGLMLLL